MALVALTVAANEWRVDREATNLEEKAVALIDELELPPWMIEVEREAVGFHCYSWSGCQERFVSVVYEIHVSKASANDRLRPCGAIILALRGWVVEHAPLDQCEVFASLEGSSLAGGVFEEGFKPLPSDATLDHAERSQLSVYV
jgi:hypothetical protein